MYINATTVLVTLVIVAIAFYGGLQLVRSFALSIAQENHEANAALDATEEERRLKRERDADAAAASAFAKVEPLLPADNQSKPKTAPVGVVAADGGAAAASPAVPDAAPPTAPAPEVV